VNIVVGTAFRNSSNVQINRFFNQVLALKNHAGDEHSVRVVAVEGDSEDDTRQRVATGAKSRKLDLDLRHLSHGGPVFGSTEAPERMAALSKVGNEILNGVTNQDDVLVYVESDLGWDPHTIGSLVDVVAENRGGFDVITPLVMAGSTFYDIWAFRKNGSRFGPFKPYHPELSETGITEVDSVGSCLVMRAEVGRMVRMTDGALVEWGNNARRAGFKIGVYSEFKVKHL
jgi:GT2 family glycosyltransferase